MGFTYAPMTGDSPLYNPRFYPSIGADGMLTYDFAQTLYLSKNDFRLSYLSGVIPGSATSGSAIVLDETLSLTGLGALSCASLTINGSPVGSSPYITGVVAGTAAADKALVLDTSRNIGNINTLSTTGVITSTLIQNGQTNRSVNGASVCVLYHFIDAAACWGTTRAHDLVLQTNNTARLTINGTTGGITCSNSLSATALSGTISTAAQPNITSLGSSTSLKVSSTLAQITLASSFADSYDISIVKAPGTDGQTSSLAFILSANPASHPTGSIVAVRTGTLGVGTMNFLNRSTTMLSYTDTTLSAKNLSLDLTSTGINSPAYLLSGVSVPMSLLTTVVAGTGAASKVLSLNATRDVSNINNLTATKLTGTIQTANQPNITGLGTLGSLTVSNTFADALAMVNTSTSTSASISFNNGSYFATVGLRGSVDGLGAANSLVIRHNSIDSFIVDQNGRIAMNGYSLDPSYAIKCSSISCDGIVIAGNSYDFSTLGATAGVATVSKALVLDSLGSCVFGLGNTTTNALKWYGSTAYKEIYSMFRDSDDGGLTIASTAQTTQKASPILRLVSGYNVSAASGTSSAAFISHLVSDVYEVNFGSQGDLHRFALFSGYSLSVGDRIGGVVDSSSIICSDSVLNICPGTSSTSVFTTSNNLLLGPNGCLINSGTFPSSSIIKLAVKGSASFGSSYASGDSQLNVLDGTNGSTQVLFRLGNSLSSNNAMTIAWIPTSNGSTANRISFDPYGVSAAMVITCARRVGIGTNTPVAPLHVAITVSYTWNSASSVGLSVYRLRTDSGVTESSTGSATAYTNTCAIFNGYIGCEALVMQSDRRLKMNIEDAELDWVNSLYKDVKVKSYRWKAHPDKNKELGIIAQDLLSLGYVDLIAQSQNDDPELLKSSDDVLEPVGVKLSVDYPKLTCYNMRMIQSLLERIEQLEALVGNIATET